MKIPDDAFVRYAMMGPGRSYRALATELRVSKRAVVNRASSERWQEKLQQLEAGARTEALQRLQEEYAAVLDRHLRAARAIQGKALEALRSKPIETARDAVWALTLAQREERELLGPPSPPVSGVIEVERRVREISERVRTAAPGVGHGEGSQRIVGNPTDPA